MADIDIGSIGGTLFLVDKGWSSTLGAAEKALGSVDKATSNFTSRLQAGQKVIDDWVAKAREIGGVSEKQIFAFESIGNALGAVEMAAGPAGIALKAVGIAVAAIGAAAVAAAGSIYLAANKAADLGDELLTMSKKTDVSVESLSAWRFISEQVGVSLGSVANSVSKFTADLGKGTKSFESAVAKIGLNVNELRNMEPEKAFQKTIDALGAIPNAADRAALGVAVFGRQFKELKPLIDEDTAAMRRDFEAFGGTITKQMAVAADAFNDAKARLGAMFEAIVVQIGSAFHVPLTAVFTAIGDAWIETRKRMEFDSAKFIEFIDRVAVFFIEAMGNMIRVVGETAKVLAEFFSTKYIGDFKLLDVISETGQKLANLQMVVAKLQGDQTAFKWAEGIAQVFKVTNKFTSDAAANLESLRAGINVAADATITFGKTLSDNAAKAVKAARDAANSFKDETVGTFKGLAEVTDKEMERAWKAYNKWLQKMDDAADKALKQIFAREEKKADKSMDLIGKMFMDSVKDAEDADRKMRRLTTGRVEFEIREIQRRFDKEVQGFKDSGVGAELLQKRIAAAMKSADADITAVVVSTTEFKDALLLANAAMTALGPLGYGAFAQVADGVQDVASEIEECITLSDILKESFENIGGDMVASIFQGFKTGGLSGAIGSAAKTMGNALGGAMTSAAVANMGKFWGNIAGMAYTQILGFMIDQAMQEFGQSERLIAADREAQAMFTDILSQFGGSRRALDEAMERAGVDRELQAKIRGSDRGEGTWSSPEMLAREWDEARIALADYQSELAGLNKALGGVERIASSVLPSFFTSAEEQLKKRLEAQGAIIDAMEAEGATAEEIAQKVAYFADLNSGAIFTATEDQIADFNRLGTIAGGVIANIAGRTGDMVAAFQAAAGTLDPMLEISRSFDMSGQINASTEQVLRFYGIIKDNADVFAAVQGVGQVFQGLGDAQIQNLELVNALGNQLEDSALQLEAAGVSVTDIYAMLSPQLQQLWEVVEDGELAVDETTRALLDQAEAQGVVGNSFRDINEQILMVLTEIRDMFADDLPEAVNRFGDSVNQTGNAVRRTLGAVGDSTLGTGEDIQRLGDDLEELSKIRVPPIRIDFEVGDLPEIPADWNWEGNPIEPASYRTGSDGFQQFGEGTPAVLHGLERVQTYSDYMSERREDRNGVIVELDGEVLVAYNARHAGQWARVRAGRSTRTVG